jgi:hypothetical protein
MINMYRPKKNQILIMLVGAGVASVIGFSANTFAGSVSTPADETASDDVGDAYLQPCGETCTASTQDYENLTTFELLAKYPELSNDTSSNVTSVSGSEEIGNSTGLGANGTGSLPIAPLGNNTMSNQTNTGNSTGNSTIMP